MAAIIGSIIRTHSYGSIPHDLQDRRGVVLAIDHNRLTVNLEGSGVATIYPDEYELLEAGKQVNTQFSIGDVVKVIPAPPGKPSEGSRVLGAIAQVIGFDPYRKEALPKIRFLNGRDPGGTGGTWYIWAYEIEKLNLNLPNGVMRCSVCVDATTSDKSGICCDCNRNVSRK